MRRKGGIVRKAVLLLAVVASSFAGPAEAKYVPPPSAMISGTTLAADRVGPLCTEDGTCAPSEACTSSSSPCQTAPGCALRQRQVDKQLPPAQKPGACEQRVHPVITGKVLRAGKPLKGQLVAGLVFAEVDRCFRTPTSECGERQATFAFGMGFAKTDRKGVFKLVASPHRFNASGVMPECMTFSAMSLVIPVKSKKVTETTLAGSGDIQEFTSRVCS